VKVTFLGTGTSQGVPMIGCDCVVCRSADPKDKRLRPSIFVETDDGTGVLVDAGPDLRAQALRHDLRRVDAIILTHSHADHILGLDDIRRYNMMYRRAMPCYADAPTIEQVRSMFSYVFDPATPRGGGLPHIETFEIAGPFCIGHTEFTPIPIWHGARKILGLRVGSFAYLTDCSQIPDEAWPLLQDLDVVVIDALRDRRHPTHFSLDEAVEAGHRIGAGQVYFTHMCHDLGHANTCARLPAGMELAYDGLVVDLGH
jgi:phosphoribosyl 1,2-cyclic phosphate phosphodiesterase